MAPSGARLAGMVVWTETARYPAMRDFYRDVLGLPTLAEREGFIHSRLIGAGVPCIRPPEREHWGGRIATFADPDGNIVQLLER